MDYLRVAKPCLIKSAFGTLLSYALSIIYVKRSISVALYSYSIFACIVATSMVYFATAMLSSALAFSVLNCLISSSILFSFYTFFSISCCYSYSMLFICSFKASTDSSASARLDSDLVSFSANSSFYCKLCFSSDSFSLVNFLHRYCSANNSFSI